MKPIFPVMILCAIVSCKPKADTSTVAAVIGVDEATNKAKAFVLTAVRYTDRAITAGSEHDAYHSGEIAFTLVECMGDDAKSAAAKSIQVETWAMADHLFVDQAGGFWATALDKQVDTVGNGCRLVANAPRLRLATVIDQLDRLANAGITLSAMGQTLYLALRGPYNPRKASELSPQILRLEHMANQQGLTIASFTKFRDAFLSLDKTANPCLSAAKEIGWYKCDALGSNIFHYSPIIRKLSYEQALAAIANDNSHRASNAGFSLADNFTYTNAPTPDANPQEYYDGSQIVTIANSQGGFKHLFSQIPPDDYLKQIGANPAAMQEYPYMDRVKRQEMVRYGYDTSSGNIPISKASMGIEPDPVYRSTFATEQDWFNRHMQALSPEPEVLPEMTTQNFERYGIPENPAAMGIDLKKPPQERPEAPKASTL